MRKRILVGIISVTMLVLLAGCGNKDSGEVENLRKQVENLQEELKEAQDISDTNADAQEQLEAITEERDSLKTELDTVTKERDSLNEQISTLEADQSLDSQGKDLIDLLFPVNGRRYHGDEKVTFYKDKLLSERIGTGEDIVFISKEKREGTVDVEKGMKVWMARSESGVVYSVDSPGLKEIKTE